VRISSPATGVGAFTVIVKLVVLVTPPPVPVAVIV